MGRKKKAKTSTKRNYRRKSDTDQNSNETVEDERIVNKSCETEAPILDDNQLSGGSGLNQIEKSNHKRFGKFRCLERKYSSSQEDEADDINTESLQPLDIQNIVLGNTTSYDDTTIRKDDDILEDTCLQGEIGHEEIIEATMICENITCDIEDVAVVANSIEIYNEESSDDGGKPPFTNEPTSSIVNEFQAMNVSEIVNEPQPPFLNDQLDQDVEIKEAPSFEQRSSILIPHENEETQVDPSDSLIVHKSEKVKCYPVKKPFQKEEDISSVPNSELIASSVVTACVSPPLPNYDPSVSPAVPTENITKLESAKMEISAENGIVTPINYDSKKLETVNIDENIDSKPISEPKIEESSCSSKDNTDDTKTVKSKTEEVTTVRRRSNRIKVNRWSEPEPEVKPVDQMNPLPQALPPIPSFETDKPVKVKSRWRRTSELEMSSVTLMDCEQSPVNSKSSARSELSSYVPAKLPLNKFDPEVEERLKTFQIIIQNIFLTVRSRSKEAKRMTCDCTLTKEEIARGDLGCGDDCLNRLLMIECGSRCMLGDLCSNKRFQNCQYAKCEVVKTVRKGLGLVASVDIERGDFLLEYVGEVLDQKEFRRRAKEYAKEKNKHYYFMALKSDSVIDATFKGNVSRFINHSCDPNAETQKWTVNGELRIGFFSKRFIAQGDEITFDYQLQRYGKEAQRCYCESQNCRGWIGEDPEKDKEKDKTWTKKEKKEKKRKEKERKELREMDLEEEIEKLSTSGVKNQAHTLMLSRLMVRAEDRATRLQLLSIAQAAEAPCRQLFLDYHGLTLLWSWMMDNHSTNKIKLQILNTLQALPITNKTILRDSKVLSVVEKWAKKETETTNEETKERNTEEEEGGSTESGDSPSGDSGDAGKAEDESKDGMNNEIVPSEVADQDEHSEQEVVDSATALLEKWADLKEDFRIPKKERIEQMKEHEREADGVYSDPREAQSYDRHWNYDKDGARYYSSNNGSSKERRHGRESPEHDWRRNRADDRNGSSHRMSKMQRRQLFAMKVQEEDRHRKQVEEMWTKHQEQCLALGVDPHQTTMFHNNFPYYPPLPPPHVQQEGVMEGADMHMFGGGMLPGPRFPPGAPPPGFIGVPPPPGTAICPPHQFPPPTTVPPYLDPQFQGVPPAQFAQPPPSQVFGAPTPFQPPPTTPQFPFPSPNTSTALVNSGLPVNLAQPPAVDLMVPPPSVITQVPPPQVVTNNPTAMATNTANATVSNLTQPPPPPPPSTSFIPFEIPPKWRATRDSHGRCYFYHVKNRISQWQIPGSAVSAKRAAATHVFDSDFSSTESSEEEDSSSEDEVDEKEEEDEVEYDDLLLSEAKRKARVSISGKTNSTDVVESTDEVVAPVDSQDADVEEPVQKKKREGLVQVNIISPREGESDYRKGVKKSKIRETKEKLMKRKKLARLKRHRDSAKFEADTSSGPSRRIKDLFRIQMANEVVACLNPYRKQDCKVGRITNTDDFKHLARKLTHFVMVKEIKHCSSIEDLACNDNVKHKARDFIRKYMNKFGFVYARSPDD